MCTLLEHLSQTILRSKILRWLGLGLCLLGLPVLASVPTNGVLDFEILRADDPFGRHTLTFEEKDGELHVKIDIRLQYKVAFVTLFNYEHENREVWRDGKLVSIETKTDDDGDKFWLKAKATAEGLAVEGSSGSYLAPADTFPTSYWNIGTIDKTELLDTQSGRIASMTVTPVGKEDLVIDGKTIAARKYQMRGDIELDVWYGPNDEMLKIEFSARGADVVYRPWNGSAS